MPFVNQDLGGGYRLIVQIHSHQLNTSEAFYIPSHIRQNRELEHFNLKLYKNGDEVFNLHQESYQEGDDRCLSSFETATPVPHCLKQCFDSDPDLGQISDFASAAMKDLQEAADEYANNHSGAAAAIAAAIVAAIAFVGPETIAAAITLHGQYHLFLHLRD